MSRNSGKRSSSRSNIVEKIKEAVPRLSDEEAHSVFEIVFRSLSEEIVESGKATVSGFGTFQLVKRTPRKDLVTPNGVKCRCEPHMSVRFTPGASLRRLAKSIPVDGR